MSKIIEAELISIDKDGAHCWLEITEGMRVRANIPEKHLQGLNLLYGREFLWDVDNRRALSKPEPRDTAERRELRRELDRLRKEFEILSNDK